MGLTESSFLERMEALDTFNRLQDMGNAARPMAGFNGGKIDY